MESHLNALPLSQALERLHALGVPPSAERLELWIPLGAFDLLVPRYGDARGGPSRSAMRGAFADLNEALAEAPIVAPEDLARDAHRRWRAARDEAIARWLLAALERSPFADGSLGWWMAVNNAVAFFDLRAFEWRDPE